ncbi:MAG TPA: VWA domain-containing protein [Candidatus Acidoferrales bacterium]|jgi:Ca-activated chloride channel homolog|nr:VWA domain-containing protein [Candidatus Acidoferrales bacterium]
MRALLIAALAAPLTLGWAVAAAAGRYAHDEHAQKAAKLPAARQLDKGVVWTRDPVTGELRAIGATRSAPQPPSDSRAGSHPMQVLTQMVPVTCVVSAADGSAVQGLRRADFRIFEDGVAQPIAYFDASTAPASVALVIDASPSVLRDSEEMKQAADALITALAPLDQAAVVDFSAHTYLELPFSDVREQARRAVARVDVRQLFGDVGGSNIYEAVYFAAKELFPGRTGRKAILLLTDGQDSGLGLTYDPASASPQPGKPADRLTFDDVARTLAAQDIQLFVVSTETRPKVMTPEWIDEHKVATILSPNARLLDIPPYTLYLAELVRRAGGQLYFLREAATMADTFRKIAEKIRAEYNLGFYPAVGADGAGARPGWHSLRVEVPGEPGAQVSHRAAYYVPATH